ncbi:DNA-3-methyladenine glycosylase I [Marinobacterium nitratireducens]|uniref:DNA-3-methyladenine glycosylase I n=1 Tax=Marinobacterium nitratireducens TaxID=518897 RepID=A0A918DNU1_9GAMM|nr:DNA-3-methyladenine glycosylase I [Marinobacterium nitratireducens]GGO77481.1 DNA-3-methyladenine glycosylase I [Marinobacterium nitratireducens]
MGVCAWAASSELERAYHDAEWGRPQADDRVLFEFLLLEGAQAGLSWRTVLEKRDGYRQHFLGFDPQRVAALGTEAIETMLTDPGVIRHRGKLESAVGNARVFLDLQARYGSFASFLWQFVDGRPVQNQRRAMAELPAETPQSQRLSKELKRLGMRFVGPTICYAYMQAVGLVNDHLIDCPCHAECRAEGERFSL